MMEVYAAITAVQSELATIGISKDKKNDMQGYNFRGIDDVYNVLAPVLAKNKLCILPRVLARECVERTSAKGGALFYVTVEAEFDLVSAVDGSKHTVKTYGEAMDSGDKATNKAMSAAYKYAAFQTFCIPVDAEDADATSHEVKAKGVKAKAEARVNPPKSVLPPTPPSQVQPPDVPNFVPPPDVLADKMATKEQITKIQVMMKGLGHETREAVLDSLTAFFDRVIHSSKELTKVEASDWIEGNQGGI